MHIVPSGQTKKIKGYFPYKLLLANVLILESVPRLRTPAAMGLLDRVHGTE